MTEQHEKESQGFVATKAYRRFSEMCDGCRIELFIVEEANRLKDAGLEVMYVMYNLEQRGRLLDNLHDVYSALDSDVPFQKSRARLYIIRDIADRGKLGLVLLGMPGLDKRLMRAPQRYSLVGFAQKIEPLSDDETRFFLDQRWGHCVSAHSNDFTDQEAVATILRITRGNIRLIERLMMQVEHILAANQLQVVTKEVVETVRENLIIGD
jgi:DNA transposition AAA+ family ATPase